MKIKNKNRRSISCFFPVVLFIVFSSFPVSGGIFFSGLDLSGDNQLLFHAGSGYSSVQEALFVTRLPAAAPEQGSAGFPAQQLTAFPEKMDLLENGRVLQIRNIFGAARLSLPAGLPMPIPGLPSFSGGTTGVSGRSGEMASSADGRWLLYLEPTSAAFGDLVMVDMHSGVKTQVASRLERPEKFFPASWSPDSRMFVYERDGKLYYYMAGTQAVPENEKIRFIGDGAINSIFWGRAGDFYYLSGSTLFRVRSAELITRALYADFLAIGTSVGTIPFEFDPGFDSFWVAPDGRSLLVSKGHRSLFYYPFDTEGQGGTSELPYLLLPRSCSGINVLWSNGGIVTVLVSIPGQTGTDARAWRLDLSGGKGAAFEPLPPPGTGSFALGSLSPDGSLALLWGDGGILLCDYANWKPLETLGSRPGTACLWAADDVIITGDDEKIEQIRLSLPRVNTVLHGAGPLGSTGSPVAGKNDQSGTPLAVVAQRDLVCLSRAPQAGFEEDSFRILAKSGDSWFVTDGKTPWTQINNPRLRSASQVSAQYRVFIEHQGSGPYMNLPMIRNTASVGTFPLFPPPPGPRTSASVPAAESDVPYTPGTVFNRGQRNGAKEAALCFDLYDNDEGLPETLDALNRRGIKATFFLNGEFIRRHPLAVQNINAAGHEAASMFFVPLDFSDARYRVDSDFITRGLARNEDEFYRVTGKELALIWHSPWYMVTQDIVTAAAGAGYITTGRDVDPMDWVSRDDEKRLGRPQRSPSEMVDLIMGAVKPGSIIPVRLGFLPGGRKDYLFNRVNVLIDALLGEGYTLTTVSALVQHAK